MRNCMCPAAWIFVAIVALAVPAHARVKAWEGKISIPTYQLAPGDPNPRIQELDNTIVYPYTMQDEFTTRCLPQDHRALFLENEYLKVTILPDINGRIHSVFDKTTGQEMFHTSDVIRPARIALRGAWIFGGVGWNAGPQAHSVVSYSPLNSSIENHPDGSASVLISNTRQDTRLRWQVRVTLHPGLALIDEQIRIFNPTDGVHAYYFWNNTSFPNNDDCTRIIWPATLICDHYGTKFNRWPIDKGIDMSRLKNYHDTAAMFAYKCVFDFFGAYSSSLDRGIVQFGDHRVLPGKKAWTWGKSDYGRLREAVMGHKDTEYIEIQSGPLPTQSDYEFLDPHRQIAWQECWYPVHGLGDGFEFATRDVAIQTDRPAGGDLNIRMIATSAFKKANLRVERDGKTLAEQTTNLTPNEPLAINVPQAASAPVRILVTAKDGRVLADYKSPLEIPYEEVPKLADAPTSTTAEGSYLLARRLDKNSDRVQARQMYERTLGFYPNHPGALRALAVLDIESARYDQALERLARVLKIEPADGQARYLASVAELSNGNLEKALIQAYEAIRRPETRSLGWDVAGRAYMRQGQVKKAVEAFRSAVAADPTDLRARDHLLIALMADDDTRAVRELADEICADDDTNLIAWLAQTAVLKNKLPKPSLGEPDFEAIEAAAEFSELGRCTEAEHLITAICGDNPQNRLTLYWLAWIVYDHQPARAQKLRAKAAAATDNVYASNPMAYSVLSEAIKANPNDARAKCDLANLLAGLGRLDDAVVLWQRAVETDPKQAVAWRNLGLYEWKTKKNLKASEANYTAAAQANPADQTCWRDRAYIMMQDRRPADALALLNSMPTFGVKIRDDIQLILVRANLETGRYDDALKILDTTHFTAGEFTFETHELFVAVLIARGKQSFDRGDNKAARADFERALTYPRNLGIGKRSKPAEAQQYFWLGKALQKLGKTEQAREAWKTGATQEVGQPGCGKEQASFKKQCAEALKTI
ncbi:DUF5107 domain-containing protein [bacterium]|nr:DUF5107 domain-containing protein [bacterium]